MSADDWSLWMVQAQAGDRASYHRLLQALRQWLKRYFARRLPPAMVEDAVQETLIAIHEKRHTYEGGRSIGPWVAAIARYKWIDRLRAMKRTAAEPLSDTLATEDHERAVISANILERLLAELRPGQAECIRLVKLRGFSIEEASAHTGQSASLVKINIHRGLARLTRAVEKQAYVDG